MMTLIFKTSTRTHERSTYFEIRVVMYFSCIGQPTSTCVCYRIENTSMEGFHATCNWCQYLSNVHCWRDWIWFTLLCREMWQFLWDINIIIWKTFMNSLTC